MKSRAPVLLAALLVVGGAIAWLAIGLLGDRGDSGVARTRAAEVAPVGTESVELGVDPVKDLEPAASPQRERARPSPVALGSDDPRVDPELRAASWVEGRVELASGTPMDEDAYVVAKGRSFDARPLYRGKVGADGRFRVAFAQGTQVGWLQISARYNFLADDLAVRPSKPQKDIVLKGSLGGCVRGRISVPPAGLVFLEDVKKGEVSVGEHEFDFFTIGRTIGRIADDLSYEVGGIDPAGGLNLTLKARGLVPLHQGDITVEAGRATLVDLAPDLGIRLSGRVVNAAGEAVAEARVSPKRAKESGPMFWSLPAFAMTSSDGSFELVGVEEGEVSILAQKQGFEALVTDLGTLPRGAEQKGLELKLSEGLVISGRVEFAGGRPAARALVTAVDEKDGDRTPAILKAFDANALMEREPVDTASDGTFRVSGLSPGTYTVTAEAWVDAAGNAAVVEDDGGVDRARKVRRKGTPWSGRLERVSAGTSDLVVSLKNGDTIRGRIVDSDGKPIERFVVSAAPDSGSPGYSSEIKEIERAFRDKDGRFALEGLRACGWTVNVRAKGHLDAEPAKITVPGSNLDLRFKLLKQARLKGIVLDPEKKPVARAKVVCGQDSGWWYAAANTHTNEKGEFTLTQVPIGAVRMHAEANGFARGEPLRFELGPGAEKSGLVLSVAAGGAIRGTVKKGDGTPDAGRFIHAEELDGNWDKRVKTDDQGEFKIEGLGPGRYKLVTQETRNTKVKMGDSGQTIDVPTEEEISSAIVSVRAGETVSVTLGAERSLSIRMHGRITVPGGRATKITATPLAGDGPKKGVDATVGEDGAYEMRLTRAGPHQIVIERDLEGFDYKTSVRVPAAADFAQDFEFPTGIVSGRVVTADDEPVKNYRVRAVPRGSRDTLDDTNRHNRQTDDKGGFEFQGLPAGTYTIEAIGPSQWWNDEAVRGHARIEGVTVTAGEPVRDLVLALKTDGSISGTVRSASGDAMPFVEVFAFDEHGHAFEAERGMRSNSAGRFTLENAPVGRVLLYARTVHSAGKAVALAREDGPAEVDIALRPRADLTVLVQDAGGAATYAPLEIVDEEGRHFEEVPPLDRFLDPAAGARAFPSLPPGKYSIRAFGLGSGTIEKSALLSEGGRADVILH